jgi:hypothetical protein
MSDRIWYATSLLIVGLVFGAPHSVLAQSVIDGTVRDLSGRAMAGVMVEASSPALIEQARTTFTDDEGRYRIEDLRSGVYAVRFALKGWQPRQVQNIELTGTINARVDAVLGPAAVLAEITVTGVVPTVDVQTVRRELPLTAEAVRALPTARTYNALLVLVPGVVTSANDTVTETGTVSFPVHGGRANEGRLVVDGLTVGSPPSGNSAPSYAIDVGRAQDVAFSSAASLGESETGGLVMNIVLRSGGNATHGSFLASGSGGELRSENVSPDLRAQGVTATAFSKVYDFTGTLGGAMIKDRLWYFASGHTGGSRKDSTNVFYNLNAGHPERWNYVPDLARRAYSDRTFENASIRLTWQAARRHRLGLFWDTQALCRTCRGATPGLSEPQRVAPEAVGVLGRPLSVTQVTWSSHLRSTLLFDAAFGRTQFGVGNFEREPNPTRDLIRVVEQCASGCPANGSIPGLVYRSQDFSDAHAGSYLWKAAASYLTGTRSLKVGYQHTLMIDDRTWMTNTQNLTYRVNNGIPNQLTQSISPWVNDARVAWQAFFAQGQWSRDRVTFHGALRFDRAWSWFPTQQLGPSRFLPSQIIFPESRGVDSYKDFTPRGGLAFDVFGNGKTAVRVTVGKYLEGAGVSGNYANTNPTLRMPQTTPVFGTAGVSRAWTDTNTNFLPDCDLLDPNAQDLRSSGADLCGAISNRNFGKPILTSHFDPSILDGSGVRPSDWHIAASLHQQVGQRSSVAATFTRRAFDGFFVVDNLAVQPSDLTPYTLRAPLDPRLPGGGGYMISGLYDVVPEKVGQIDHFVTTSESYGAWRQAFNGFDLTVNIQEVDGVTLVGGVSVGQTGANNCDVRARLPELATTTMGTSPFGAGLLASAVTPTSPYCDVDFGWLPQVRGLAAYHVPKIDVQVSAVVQSKPGAMLAANYAASNSEVAPSLGRDLSGNAPNVTVNLLQPGTMYGDRINQVDVRAAKSFRLWRTRTTLGVDVFNAFNSSTVLTYNNTFVPGGTWLQPLTILSPRFIRLTGEIDF